MLCLVSVLCVTSARTQSIHQLNVVRVRVAGSPGQEFACVSPYTFAECERQVAILEPILHRYAAEKLGKWTWVLVRSEDWKQILTELHLNPNSPAFSHLEMRQTFVEEVLLVPEPERQVELVEKWHIPFDQFLDFAISHEMGHALCHESDEIKAERYAELLRKGSSSECATHQQQFWGRSFFSHFDKSRVLGNQGLPVPAQFASPEPVLAVLVTTILRRLRNSWIERRRKHKGFSSEWKSISAGLIARSIRFHQRSQRATRRPRQARYGYAS